MILNPLLLLAATLTPGTIAPSSSAELEVNPRVAVSGHGHFGRMTGQVVAMQGRLIVDVRLDARSLKMDGPGWVDRVTHSEGFLDSKRFPEIGFRSVVFDPGLLSKGGALHGTLRLRGKDVPVAFTVAPSGCGRPGVDCDIQALATVDRHALGMNAYRWGLGSEVRVILGLRMQTGAD